LGTNGINTYFSFAQRIKVLIISDTMASNGTSLADGLTEHGLHPLIKQMKKKLNPFYPVFELCFMYIHKTHLSRTETRIN